MNASNQPTWAAALDLTLCMAFGDNAKDNRPRQRELTLREFISETRAPATSRCGITSVAFHELDKSTPQQKAKRDRAKDGPYFIPARFAVPNTRKAADVEEICGFVLDFDSGKTSIQDVCDRLAGTFHIVWTTFSHRPDSPRLRVFIPYARPIPPDIHPGVHDQFQRLFADHPFDPRCRTTSQVWFLPACPTDAVADFKQVVGDGRLFDPVTDASPPPPEIPHSRQAPVKAVANSQLGEIRDALTYIDADDRDVWLRVGMALRHELGDAGLELWNEWSRKSQKFSSDENEKAWQSFDNDRDNGVTIGTVFHLGKEKGWKYSGARSLEEEIGKLNGSYFIAPDGGKLFVFHERDNPTTGHPEVVPMPKAHFIDAFANRTFVTTTRKNAAKVSLGAAWFTSPLRREYKGLVFAPDGAPEGYFNLWRGFSVEPRPGSWARFNSHIRDVICRGDTDSYDYVIRWLAHSVQRPTELPGVALVLQGGRGTGKGTFSKWVGQLFGSHYLQIFQARHMTGNFNAHLRDKIVLFADEAFWAGDKQGEAVLKGLITEPTLAIERKGIDVQTTKNFLRVVLASNADWVVPAGHDERRFCVLSVCDSHAQDAPYFEAIEREMTNGGLAAMLNDLMKLDISTFNVRTAPKTAALRDQNIFSMSAIEQL